MINLKYSAALLLVGSSLAYASGNPPPLPATYTYTGTGTDYLSMSAFAYSPTPADNPSSFGWGPNSATAGCGSIGCGGQFTGTLTPQGGTPSTTVAQGLATTNFWCVDSQEDFSFGNSGYADVVQLTDPNFATANVRYNGGTFTEPLGGADAQERYEMAAYLISQFPGFSSNPDSPTITAGTSSIGGTDPVTANADEIQEAIWDIMGHPSLGGSDSTVPDVIANALANYGNYTYSNFAVVSWQANPITGSLSAGPNQQTFLVELGSGGIITHNNPTPEPGFYGALALGLSGLFFAARRRKKA